MKHYMRLAVVTMVLTLSGCATTSTNPRDPYEGFNRKVFSFNDKVDQVALKPAAQAYRAVLPSFVQIGVGNFFRNLGDVWTGVNNVLQGKVGDGVSDFMRFAVNSTLGLGGVIDIGSAAGMPKHREDFGQTLGKWGVASGPYLVLPLLGSSTVRDTAAVAIFACAVVWGIEGAALDRYEFVRDGYLQRRESRVYDGEAPPQNKGSVADGLYKDPEGYVPAGPTPEASPDKKPAVKPGAKSSMNDAEADRKVAVAIADDGSLTSRFNAIGVVGNEPMPAEVVSNARFLVFSGTETAAAR